MLYQNRVSNSKKALIWAKLPTIGDLCPNLGKYATTAIEILNVFLSLNYTGGKARKLESSIHSIYKGLCA